MLFPLTIWKIEAAALATLDLPAPVVNRGSVEPEAGGFLAPA